jgi:hypothetical protein
MLVKSVPSHDFSSIHGKADRLIAKELLMEGLGTRKSEWGHCFNWPIVWTPQELGGFGILDIERLARAVGLFLRFTQYNADAHNTHTYSLLWIHVRKPYPYEHLRRTEHRQIWRFSKSPLASQHAHILTPMNTRTQTLPLWAPPKDWAPINLEILEVTTGASSSTVTSLTT